MLIPANPIVESLDNAWEAFEKAPDLDVIKTSVPFYDHRGVLHPLVNELGGKIDNAFEFDEFGLVTGLCEGGYFIRIIPPNKRKVGVPIIPENINSKTSRKNLSSVGHDALKAFVIKERAPTGMAVFSIFG